ncbi:sodium/glutamate symporter [Staphylococcus cohnii species complex 1658]|uniref:sodium/glutamate symporter n=1 Tax=Staphylococcus cohnii species complex 1658 TaxID=3239424 RepID=UPI0034D95B45
MDLLVSFSMLSFFLIIGMILRAKLKFLQKIFLPASVIGGFIGLILGPIVLGDYAILPLPKTWLSTYALLPGILIVPVVATVPIGMKFKSWKKQKSESTPQQIISTNRHMFRNIAVMTGILLIIAQGQNFLGVILNRIYVITGFTKDSYPTFGIEVGGGFSGGHGTAGVLGSLLHSMNQPYWETTQGITVTTATFGLIGGILVGVFIINMGARKKYTHFLKSPGEFPEDMRKGYQSDVKKQENFGKETTLSSSIDTLAFHLAFILFGSGIAYGILQIIKFYNIPILSEIPIWAYAIIVMYLVWWIVCGLSLDWIIDEKITSKISSMLTDFAVVAAIASMPIQAVLSYFTPILVMMIIIGAFTIFATYWLSKRYLEDYWLEKSVALLGTSMGVFITGLLLLKMTDPEFKSPILNEFSIGYSINSVVAFIVYPFLFSTLINQGIIQGILIPGVIIVVGMVLIFIGNAKKSKTIQDGGSNYDY